MKVLLRKMVLKLHYYINKEGALYPFPFIKQTIALVCKKLIFFMVLLFCTIVANATTYRVKYDVNNQSYTSFIVRVESNRLTIGSNAYLLRRMGTITSSGLTFDSYAYGSSENGMFCVATTSITIDKDIFTKLSGYIIIIDNKPYIADKLN